jgi:hypothetical protein
MTYLEALDRELKDLAPDERADLLDEVQASLEEIDDPELRLGPPERFAAELRASAGLPAAPAPSPPRRRPWRLSLAPYVRSLKELAPIWWAVRAYVVVLVAAAIFAAPVTKVGGVPRLHNAELGAVALALALVGSIAVGLAGRRRRLPMRSLRIALDLGLVACAAFALMYEIDRRAETGYSFDAPAATPLPTDGLAYEGGPLDNVYVYDRRGRLLHDVQLYGPDGRPLNVRPADRDATRRVLRTRNGAPVFNTFPIRYFEPNTTKVKNPRAAPANLKPPTLRTPPSP